MTNQHTMEVGAHPLYQLPQIGKILEHIKRSGLPSLDDLPEYRSKWRNIGYNTGSIDRIAAEQAVVDVYLETGFKPPEKIFWVQSPMGLALAEFDISFRGFVSDERSELRNLFRKYVGSGVHRILVRKSFRTGFAKHEDTLLKNKRLDIQQTLMCRALDSLLRKIKLDFRRNSFLTTWNLQFQDERWFASVDHDVSDREIDLRIWDKEMWIRGNRVSNPMTGSIVAAIVDEVDTLLEPEFASQISRRGRFNRRSMAFQLLSNASREDKQDLVTQNNFGLFNYTSLGFTEFLHDCWNMKKQTRRLRGLWSLAKNTSGFIPFENVCLVCEPPQQINLNQRGRLDNETGPSLKYRDDWSIYALNGIRVPSQVVLSPDQLTIEEIEAERNVEVRHLMMKRLGYDKLLETMYLIDEDRDSLGFPRRLLGRHRVDEAEQRYLHLTNSTPEPDGSRKEYVFRMPPGVETVRAALNWHFGFPEDATPDFDKET